MTIDEGFVHRKMGYLKKAVALIKVAMTLLYDKPQVPKAQINYNMTNYLQEVFDTFIEKEKTMELTSGRDWISTLETMRDMIMIISENDSYYRGRIKELIKHIQHTPLPERDRR